MNKEETKQAIAVMQAFVDGKQVECRFRHTQATANPDLGWNPLEDSAAWKWGDWEYRVKPQVVTLVVGYWLPSSTLPPSRPTGYNVFPLDYAKSLGEKQFKILKTVEVNLDE